MGGKEIRSDLSEKNCSLIIRIAWVTFCYMWGYWGTQGMPRQRRILGVNDRVQESALGIRKVLPYETLVYANGTSKGPAMSNLNGPRVVLRLTTLNPKS